MRRSRTEHRIALTALSTACASLALAACDPVRFDFGSGGGEACADLEPLPLECPAAFDAGCLGGGEVTGTGISGSAGCTPDGMALGIGSIRIPEGGAYDLFAWAAPVPWISSVFNEDVSLALFPDPCGEESFGESGFDCDYLPWILRTALPASEAYLHVQTADGEGLGAAAIGFQAVPSGAWDEELPPDSQPMECETVPNGPLDERLVYPDPLTGVPRRVPFRAKPPASLSGITGAPRICGASAAGWRQAGYLIENPGDPPPVRLRGVHVRTTDASTGPSVSFHYGLFRCAAGSDEVAAQQLPLASSCEDSGDSATKQMDVDVAVWDPEDSSTKYVLVLQVPPGEGTELFLQFDVE